MNGGQTTRQSDQTSAHLDSYIQEVLTEYKEYIKKALRQKRVPMSPGLVLDNEDCPLTPVPQKQ